ncbi:MAG: LuxR C-terminal-related transcriptional regulator [Treponema sp.]|nr:LuxR C-terminal-related transcriptional regulator [Treponema sp.]
MKNQDTQNKISASLVQPFLERPRVDALLEKTLNSNIVTIVAGEGCGKTSAVYAFLRKHSEGVLWIQISEQDNLGWHFWENYTEAIGKFDPKAGKALRSLGFPETAQDFDRYINFLYDNVPETGKFIIVLDDFHLIHDPAVLRYFEYAFRARIANQTVFVLSRTEPRFNTLPALSKGWLSHISAEDLRFSEEETARYFALHGMSLPQDELLRVYQDTEGWALAIDLTARDMKNHQGRLPDLLWKNSVKKAMEQIFISMDRATQRLLIKCSLAEHWPGEFLEVLDPEGKSIAALGDYSSVIRYDLYLNGYRIHHVFLEYLREKQGELEKAEIRAALLWNAEWCVKNNLIMEAAAHYGRIEEYKGLMGLLTSLPRLLPVSMGKYFLSLIENLPPPKEEENDEDQLFLYYVMRPKLLMLSARFDESRREYLNTIERFEKMVSSPFRPEGTHAQAAGGSLNAAQRLQIQPSEGIYYRILAATYNNLGTLTLITSRRTKDYNYLPWFEKGNYYYRKNPQVQPEPLTKCSIGAYVCQVGSPAAKGEFEKSVEAFSLAIPFASDSLGGYLYGVDVLALAELAYFRGNLDKAEQYAREAFFKAREKDQYEVEHRGLFILLRIELHRGNYGAVGALLRQMDSLLQESGFLNRLIMNDTITGWFFAHIGMINRMAHWLRNESDEMGIYSNYHSLEILVKAKKLFAEQDYQALLTLWERKVSRDSLGSFHLGRLEMAVLEAASRLHLEDENGALKSLENAWEMASLNDLEMPFIEMGDEMCLLFRAAIKTETSIPRPWLESIDKKASVYAKKLAIVERQFREENAGKIFLTRREKRVLGGLAQGLTREEIARKGDMPVSAVKTIIKQLYTKLMAVNRADLIGVATKKGFL